MLIEERDILKINSNSCVTLAICDVCNILKCPSLDMRTVSKKSVGFSACFEILLYI